MKNTNRGLKITAFLLSFGLIACTTPVKLLPPDAVNQLGSQEFSEIKQEVPQETDTRGNAYVQWCCGTHSEAFRKKFRPTRGWEVVLFRDKAVNAFALPGGKIGIYTGLLGMVENQHQLAAVIGHEVGHVILEHGNQQISQDLLVKGGLAAIERLIKDMDPQEKQEILAGLGLGAQIGLALPYSRHHEIEADQIGLELMAKAGFDPRESVTLWENMNQIGGQQLEFLSTHPSDENRIKDLRSRMTHALRIYEQAEKADCDNVRLALGEWGSWTYEDGSRYEGEWQNNMRHGKGILTWPDGARYEGEWRNDLAHGKGAFIWPDGSHYMGEWQSDKKHGKGALTWSNGSRYEGEWQNNMRHGEGTLIWPDGERYVGQWRSDKKHGRGTYIWLDGKHYEGEWRGDKKHGKGVLTWPDGARYEGEWQDNMAHGRGSLIWPDGERYVGQWRSDKMHGKGIYIWPDGERYEGEWRDDKMHGKGTYFWPDGSRYEGEWQDDMEHGKGTFTSSDGRRFKQEWHKGELVTTNPY